MEKKVYICLFSRPAYPGTYHWAIYNNEKSKLYHIVGQQNAWSKEVKEKYGAWNSRTLVTAIYVGDIDDKLFQQKFNEEEIRENDTCRIFIMRIYYNIFGVDNNIENFCIEKANENAPNVERGKKVSIHEYKS